MSLIRHSFSSEAGAVAGTRQALCSCISIFPEHLCSARRPPRCQSSSRNRVGKTPALVLVWESGRKEEMGSLQKALCVLTTRGPGKARGSLGVGGAAAGCGVCRGQLG